MAFPETSDIVTWMTANSGFSDRQSAIDFAGKGISNLRNFCCAGKGVRLEGTLVLDVTADIGCRGNKGPAQSPAQKAKRHGQIRPVLPDDPPCLHCPAYTVGETIDFQSGKGGFHFIANTCRAKQINLLAAAMHDIVNVLSFLPDHFPAEDNGFGTDGQSRAACVHHAVAREHFNGFR
jgi:hypothetical protein